MESGAHLTVWGSSPQLSANMGSVMGLRAILARLLSEGSIPSGSTKFMERTSGQGLRRCLENRWCRKASGSKPGRSANSIQHMRRRFACIDCREDTGKMHEHYFVHTDLWLAAVGTIRGMLCVGCLEERLGRKLVPRDFPDVCINDPRYEPKSARLMKRLTSPRRCRK